MIDSSLFTTGTLVSRLDNPEIHAHCHHDTASERWLVRTEMGWLVNFRGKLGFGRQRSPYEARVHDIVDSSHDQTHVLQSEDSDQEFELPVMKSLIVSVLAIELEEDQFVATKHGLITIAHIQVPHLSQLLVEIASSA